MSGAPLFVAAAQGTPLDHLDHQLGWQAGLVFLGPRDCNKQTVIDCLPSPGYLCTQQTETHPQYFCERSLYVCLELSPEGQASGLTHLRAYLDAQLGWRLMDAIFALSFCLTPSGQYLRRKNLYTCWCADFYSYHPGDISRQPGSSSQWDVCLQTHKTVYICIH